MRILVDYRPALRQRTGVGEYIHHLARALAVSGDDTVSLFSSSWRDRVPPDTASTVHAQVIDRRIPVRLLNLLWHRFNWPPVEQLVGPGFDVVHAAHPLLMPTRRAAQVVTIHDLFFLTSADQTSAEIRRDYPRLVGRHARHADAIVTSSAYGRQEIVDRLEVPGERVHVCAPGAPTWPRLGHRVGPPTNGYALFLGTLEPRKNIGRLLDAVSAGGR